MGNKAATFSFLDKVFGAAHSPPRGGGVSATSKTMDPFRFVADGVVSSARLRRPDELTTITASRYRARALRPSAPLLWLRSIFLMAHPPLLCEEGWMTHSSSVQTATSLTFGCGFAALCLLWSGSRFLVQSQQMPIYAGLRIILRKEEHDETLTRNCNWCLDHRTR